MHKVQKMLTSIILALTTIVFAAFFCVYFMSYQSLNNQLKAQHYGGHDVRLIAYFQDRQENQQKAFDQNYISHKSHETVADLMMFANQKHLKSNETPLFNFQETPTFGKYITHVNGVGDPSGKNFYWQVLSPTFNNLMSYHEFDKQLLDIETSISAWSVNVGVSFIPLLDDMVIIVYQTRLSF